MEDDNAHDLHKFVTSQQYNEPAEATITWREKSFKAKIILQGNVLSVAAIEEAHVPLIFVVEKAVVRRLPSQSNAQFMLELKFACDEDNVTMLFESEKKVEHWMVKLATCSHEISRAQLDELAYKFFTMGSCSDITSDNHNSSSFLNYFLANPIKATHVFAVSQANGLPSRRITLEETMWESKLSLLLPTELIKLYRKWTSDFCCLLESKVHFWPAISIPHIHEIIREVRDNAEMYEQCSEFMSTYSGPSFRKSIEKHRVAFGAVPTNLHLQTYGIANEARRDVLTCGTASAFHLRFVNGGLTRLLSSLDISPTSREIPFFSKRYGLLELKRSIGDLSHKMDVEWKMSSFGKPDKICLEINTGIKQVYEKLKDTFLRTIPELEKHIDVLYEECRKPQPGGKKLSPIIYDSLQNQIDNIDAMMISLNTKIAVIDTLDDEQRCFYEKSAREAMSMCLDSLLTLTDNVLEAQLFGFVMSLKKPATVHQFFHIQIRSDFVFSQAVTIAATAIMSRVQQQWSILTDGSVDMLLVIFSFLSPYGDERGMIEDASEAWRMVENKALFKFVRAPSSVCRNCIPVVSGTRSAVHISLPLPQERFDDLPEELKVRMFRVTPAFFNVGVNHEATLSQSFGGTTVECGVNQEGALNILSFSNRVNCSNEARDTVMELVNAISTEGSRKNLAIFEWAMAACEALNGVPVISCKSGKDRTGMAVTLEQGRVVRQTCGLGINQVGEVVSSLRKDGLRRENCRKNVGKALYSFSPFQMHFLPKSFRPPMGTYAQGVAS